MAPRRKPEPPAEPRWEPPADGHDTLFRKATWDELEPLVNHYAKLGFQLCDWDRLEESKDNLGIEQLYYAMFERDAPVFCDGCKEQIRAEAEAEPSQTDT